MTPNEYQKAALRTANPSDMPYGDLIIGALGLAGEGGEVADHVKKFIGQGHELDRDHVVEECGDVLWYISLTLNTVGCDLETCMQRNIDKLYKRYPDGFDAEHSIHREA